MDLMNPDVVWVSGSAFRTYCESSAHSTPEIDHMPADLDSAGDTDNDDDPAYSVHVTEHRGGHRALLHVPSVLYGSVIGRGGRSLRQFESQTGCRVLVPRDSSNPAAAIEVTAPSSSAVRRCCRAVLMSVERARQRMAPTHFVGVRVSDGSQVQRRFCEFRDAVLSRLPPVTAGGGGGRIKTELFQYPARLHVTFCMLTLLSRAERQQVADKLREVISRVLCDRAGSGDGSKAVCRVCLRGLDIMNDDPSAARVLYARVTDCHDDRQNDGHDDVAGASSSSRSGHLSLQLLADSVLEGLAGTGLMSGSHSATVKLHCTLINSSFEQRHSPEVSDRRCCSTFDASAVLRDFADYEFGSVSLDCVQLLERFSHSQHDHYYTVSASVPL